jgi:Pyruvate/2-oxoacid:ferredoxin oxidoreductase gamma subunit
MVALGAYVGATGSVDMADMEEVVRETFASKPKVIESNVEALRRGYELGKASRE